MKIYSPKDRFKVSVESLGIAFVLASLTAKQKGDVLACVTTKGGNQLQDRWEMVKLSLKYSVKGLEGFEDGDGEPLKLIFDDGGNLSDESVDVLLNMGAGQAVMIASSLQFATGGVPDAIIDAETGKAYEGVTLVRTGKA
jgi:hypothetical protein